MRNMKEEDFYDMLDIVETIMDVTNGYFPTVEEMEEKNMRENMNDYLIAIAYFASDPFNRCDREPDDMASYKETVAYCQQLLLEYKPS